MKNRFANSVLIFMLPAVLLVLSCSFQNPTDIQSWLPAYKQNTVLTYKVTVTFTDNTSSAGDPYHITVYEIDKKETRVVYTMREDDGDKYYIIADSASGMLVRSADQYFDKDIDSAYLKTPVQEGTYWYSPNGKVKYTIKGVNQSFDSASGSYKDVVVIDAIWSDYPTWDDKYYWSPSAGYLGNLFTPSTTEPVGTWKLYRLDLIDIQKP